MRKSLAIRSVAVMIVGLLAATGCTVDGESGGGDARSVVERFAAAVEDSDCAELFATTTEAARADMGVTWATVDECRADPESDPEERGIATIGEVVEVDEWSAAADVQVRDARGAAATFHLQLVRTPERDAWIITGIALTVDEVPPPDPQPSADASDYRRNFLFLAEDFLTALANRDCYAVQIGTTKEFWESFAANAGAPDICTAIENGPATAPPEELTVLDYGSVDDGTPGGLWGEMVLVYSFDHQGELWDQELEFGYWHQEGAHGTSGVWKISSFRSTGSPVPHR